jgi:ribosomal protein S27E
LSFHKNQNQQKYQSSDWQFYEIETEDAFHPRIIFAHCLGTGLVIVCDSCGMKPTESWIMDLEA